jgi:DNA-binding response OmpR family regulator
MVVDDEPGVRAALERALRVERYDVQVAGDGAQALALLADRSPDAIVLDVAMPEVDGLEVCRRLRDAGPVPIIMLTALGAETDRVVGLELGADDYVTKPFSPRELTLRVDSVLRRTSGPAPAVPDVLTDGDLVLDSVRHEVTLQGGPLALTAREFDLLRFLLAHRGEAFSREDLLQEVWGWSFGDHSTVTVHVRRLREKVERDPTRPVRLVTVWGVGYRWEEAS